MIREVELLAPGGDIDSIKAAIAAGADSVYCGLDKFNARNRATNIIFDDLNGILRLAHQHNCKVFLTLNILMIESEIPAFMTVLNKLVNTSIDGIIIQDLGILYLVSTYFPRLNIHASTQLTTHNKSQIQFLSKLSVTRVNLSRELNYNEIKALTPVAHKRNITVEVFVQGSYCICFSGLCYMSSFLGGNSGNRGRCSQNCRDQFITTSAGKNFPLNLKDNSLYSNMKELFVAGVDSLKIEGRIKKSHYVYTVVDAWRKQLQRFQNSNELINNDNLLYKAFNRDFTNGYFKGAITNEMFIDNPRDHSAIFLSKQNDGNTDELIEKAKGDIYNERVEIKTKVETILSQLTIEKAPLMIRLSCKLGTPLKVSVATPYNSFEVLSESNLARNETHELNYETMFSRLKALNDTEYYIKQLDLDDLQTGVFIPFKELTAIKKQLLFILNDSREYIEPIVVPSIKKPNSLNSKPSLSVLISSPDDFVLSKETSATIYFQLPNYFKNDLEKYIELFTKNREIIPWFTSVLIGDDYRTAVEFLQQLKPKRIVTNNTGIAYEAYKNRIEWIAGPYLNCTNSFSLLCLKEMYNCSGAFISNEINKTQIQRIIRPDDFELYYSIYHPVLLMTSRQCLLQTATGCEKEVIDETCIQQCNKSTSITNLKKETFVIEKARGNYHTIYNETNFLNPDIVSDLPNLFYGFLIDLRDIETSTQTDLGKPDIIKLFKNLINEIPGSKEELKQAIHPSTNVQYRKGI